MIKTEHFEERFIWTQHATATSVSELQFQQKSRTFDLFLGSKTTKIKENISGTDDMSLK